MFGLAPHLDIGLGVVHIEGNLLYYFYIIYVRSFYIHVCVYICVCVCVSMCVSIAVYLCSIRHFSHETSTL